MIKIDIISGFLGAGKTTLIKKLLKEALHDTKVVLIENEFGEVGIDGGFLKDAGIEIKEMNSGCICCSLVGDFGASLKEVIETYHPERVLIEPSGVGKLSDVIRAVQDATDSSQVVLNSATVVVDAAKCKMYIKNFGEFFSNQLTFAETVILSRTANINEDKLNKCIELIRRYNETAVIVTTPWEQLEGQDILDTMEGDRELEAAMLEEVRQGLTCGHGHYDDEHNHDCQTSSERCGECGCHHDHTHHEGHHGENCSCSCGRGNHDHHHADEVFTSFGMETPAVYSREEIAAILAELEKEDEYGLVLRAKGMISGIDQWIYFDYVPGEPDIRSGKAAVTGKFCVIGARLNQENLKKLFEKH